MACKKVPYKLCLQLLKSLLEHCRHAAWLTATPQHSAAGDAFVWDRPRCCCALLPRVLCLLLLQAFKCMPPAVRSRLAKACQGLQLPPGALVFEEDDRGDAMYVVVAGSLQVRYM